METISCQSFLGENSFINDFTAYSVLGYSEKFQNSFILLEFLHSLQAIWLSLHLAFKKAEK